MIDDTFNRRETRGASGSNQLVSVIIPVYQAEDYVERAVRSALSQPEVYEVILVEDGSADNSLKICKQLVETYQPKIKLFWHKNRENRGPGAARNLGIIHSKSDYISFLDADDYYLNNRFHYDFQILSSDLSVDGVYNAIGVDIYDEAERNRVKKSITTVKNRIDPEELFEKMSPVGNEGYFSCNGLTVRKKCFEKVGLFDEDLRLSEDTHMWIKLAAKAKLVSGIIEEPVAMRGVHESNSTKDKRLLYALRPILFQKLLVWARQNKVALKRRKLLLYTYF